MLLKKDWLWKEVSFGFPNLETLKEEFEQSANSGTGKLDDISVVAAVIKRNRSA